MAFKELNYGYCQNHSERKVNGVGKTPRGLNITVIRTYRKH